MPASASDRSSARRAWSALGGVAVWILACGACADETPAPPDAQVDAGPACTDGERVCDGKAVAICNDGAWSVTESCPAGSPCKEGRCEADCARGQATCEGSMRHVCVEDGSGFWVEDCAPGVCRDGGCAACHPGTLTCLDDGTVGQCNQEGTEVAEVGSCNSAETKTFCHLGKCLSPCAISFKEASNVGCEYWAVDLDNTDAESTEGGGLLASEAPFAVALSNVHASVAAHVTIRTAHKVEAELVVAPGALEVAFLPERNVDGTGVQAQAWRIQSDMPLIAFQFNPLANVDVYSNDASMLLPGSILGKQYVAMSREHQGAQNRGFVAIVATVDGTKVAVTTRSSTQGNNTGTQSFNGLKPGAKKVFTLNAYDVLNLETLEHGDDLTGTRIDADKPVAVFGGSECAVIPWTSVCTGGKCADTGFACEKDAECPSPCCCDHLEEQIFPVGALGTRYFAARSHPRGAERDTWRVMAVEDGTTFATNPPGLAPSGALDAGEHVEFGADGSFELIATKPVAVGQFFAGEHAPRANVSACKGAGADTYGTCTHDGSMACATHGDCAVPCLGPLSCEVAGYGRDAGTGDPSFILLPPVSSYRADTILLAPDKYAEDFINVVLPAGAELRFDGVPVEGVERTPLGAGDYELIWSRLSDGVHHLSSDQPFGVTVYGYDQYVSYGYTGGVSFAGLTGGSGD